MSIIVNTIDGQTHELPETYVFAGIMDGEVMFNDTSTTVPMDNINGATRTQGLSFDLKDVSDISAD